MIQRIIYILLIVIIAILVIGFFFDTAPHPTLFNKYSPQSLLILEGILLIGIFCIALIRFLVFPYTYTLRGSQRTVRFGTKLLVVLSTLLFICITLESFLHIQHTKKEKQFSNNKRLHPFLQVTPEPNDATLSTNAWGFRGLPITKEKPVGTYRIFMIGGSTVYCGRIPFEDTPARRLEKILQKQYPSRSIEVQNAGMSWHTSQHSLIKIATDIVDFAPDLIIVYHGINDLLRSLSPTTLANGPYKNDYSHYWGPLMGLVRQHQAQYTLPTSLLAHAAIAYGNAHWFSDIRKPTHPELHVPIAVDQWQSLPAFERNMNHIATLAHAHTIDLLIASQPSLYHRDLRAEEQTALVIRSFLCTVNGRRVSIPSLEKGMHAFNETSQTVARAHDVGYVDLDSVVPKSLTYFRDDVHYTKKGCALIANTLAEYMIRNTYITKR